MSRISPNGRPFTRAINASAKALAMATMVGFLVTTGWINAQSQSDGQHYLKYVDQDIVLVFQNNPALKKKVQALLASNYSAFMGRMETSGGADKVQNFVVFKGCKAHNCGLEEAYLLLDVDSGKMYAAIYSETYGAKNPKMFSEAPPFPDKLLASLHNR